MGNLRVLIFGADGFLGKSLAAEFERCGLNVLRVNRLLLPFGGGNEQFRLRTIIEDFSPDIVVNAIGQIDNQLEATPDSIFSSIFLPTFYLFDYFRSAQVARKVTVLTFGSEAEGQPRKRYPIYSALKTAEANLVLTAGEYFAETNICWVRLKLPRLHGGLGLAGVADKPPSEKASFENVWKKVRTALALDYKLGEINA